MSRRILLRFALPALAVAGLLANTAIAHSQDSQSVAEAARRAREDKKKAATKPAKVITDDDVKPSEPGGSGAATPASPAASASSNSANAQAPAATSGPAGPKDEKKSKEIAGLKEMLKQMQSDLDLLQRDQVLKQDTYYSNPDYVHDTAGKSILDAIKQQIGDKQQEVDQLRTKLAELGVTLDNSSAPSKP